MDTPHIDTVKDQAQIERDMDAVLLENAASMEMLQAMLPFKIQSQDDGEAA